MGRQRPHPGKRTPEPAKGTGWLARLWQTMHRGDSVGWLVLTIMQALLTWSFIGIAKLAKGLPWEDQVKMLVIVAIVATWCMALRTIRARLLELLRQWNRAPSYLLKKASESSVNGLPAKMKEWHKVYVRKSIFRLRIIAAGITMPFFIMPVFTAALCFSLSWDRGLGDVSLLSTALVLSAMTIVVGAYFQWSVQFPEPALRPVAKREGLRRTQRTARM